jgi:aspartyl-tRNA(Asn)/glutamyl-tRNA(Gln) amidotransferase subunit C
MLHRLCNVGKWLNSGANGSAKRRAGQRRDNNPLPQKSRLTQVAGGSKPPCKDRFFHMSLTPHDIDRLAQLSRLQFEPPAAERLLGQLNGFFEIVEQMRAVDTSGVVPMAHPVDAMQGLATAMADADVLGMTLRLREDVVSEPNQRDANQRSAPAVERGLFLVPKVIE